MFVTGCHRSGTSLLASLMHGLVTGEDPSQRRGDLELKLENPLGFFESKRLVGINDALLEALGCQWDRPPLLPTIWEVAAGVTNSAVTNRVPMNWTMETTTMAVMMLNRTPISLTGIPWILTEIGSIAVASRIG